MKKQLAILLYLVLFFNIFDLHAIEQNVVEQKKEISHMQQVRSRLHHEFFELKKCIKNYQNCDKQRHRIYLLTIDLLSFLIGYKIQMRGFAQERERRANIEKTIRQAALKEIERLKEQARQIKMVQDRVAGVRPDESDQLKKAIIKKWKTVYRSQINLRNKLNSSLFPPDRREEMLQIEKEMGEFLQARPRKVTSDLNVRSIDELKDDLKRAEEIEKFIQEKESQISRLKFEPGGY